MGSKQITGKSFGCLLPTNPFRVMLHKLVSSDVFEWAINILIIVNCIFLAFGGPHVEPDSDFGTVLLVLDYVFTSIFFIEVVLKMLAFGIYKSSPKDDGKSDEDKQKELRERKLAKHKGSDIMPDDPASMPCTNAYLSDWWNRLD